MTYAEALVNAAGLMNDSNREVYDDATQLPYLNIALMELEEIFELNNIPVTNDTSAVINVPKGVTSIGFTTVPALPSNLVEIQQLFESEEGQNNFIPMDKKEFLTPYNLGNTEISFFRIWSWIDEEIRVLAAIKNIDIKIDYVKSLFTLLTVSGLKVSLGVKNSGSFLQFRVAGLCAEFIEENTTRASSLNGSAGASLERSLGISIKGMQPIFTRRRPFRAAFKRRRMMY